MDDAAKVGDVFITATGMKDILVGRHFEQMKDGAVVCNTGHYDCEINIEELEALATSKREIRHSCEEYTMPDGRRIYLLAQGRLVNLAAAEGHPSAVMDMSFANQSLCAEYMITHAEELERTVYSVPEAIDQRIATLKLEAMGVNIDVLTPEQETYLNSWQAGT